MSHAPTQGKPKLTVIGTGYLGAVHAAVMSSLGFEVLGVDVDAEKIALLARGETPFYEPELPDRLKEGLSSGRLRFTTDLAYAAQWGDVHFICVGTPQKPISNEADLTFVDQAIADLAPNLRRDCVVVGKSTVPVGTAAQVQQRLRAIAPAGDGVKLAWNPEFLREGFAVADTHMPDRIVVGAQDDEAAQVLRTVYASQLEAGVPFLQMDWATAELIKTAANSFLATKISFINSMAEICDKTGADVTVLAQAIGYDSRIGHRFLRAGIGFGGGCLPKDIRAFMARAGQLGVDDALSFLKEIDDINLRQRRRAIEAVMEMLGGELVGQRIAVLGAAFKPDSDDVRDSPALDIAAGLHLQGALVKIFDPRANTNAATAFPTLTFVESTAEACADADIVLLLTEWDEFRKIVPADLSNIVSQRRILDGRNVLTPGDWRDAGWVFRGMGRP